MLPHLITYTRAPPHTQYLVTSRYHEPLVMLPHLVVIHASAQGSEEVNGLAREHVD